MNRYLSSRDGIMITYTRRGSGPPLILIGGGLDDGSENEPLAIELASEFTTYNFARRGRGESGDAAPYEVARELEDIAALIAVAGGEAHLLGISSGGMYALEAAAAGLPVLRVAVYELPYDADPNAGDRYDRYRRDLDLALSTGRRGDAVALFMALAGSPPDEIDHARRSDLWPGLEQLAHTLAYDAQLYGPPPIDRLREISTPTLVATGSGGEFYEAAADAVAAAIPSATRIRLLGQTHIVDPAAFAPVLGPFLRGDRLEM